MAGEDHPQEPQTPIGAEDVAAVDVALEQPTNESRRPWGLIAGAGALVLAVGVGAFVVSNGESELDVAQSSPAAEASGDDGETAEPVEEEVGDDASASGVDEVFDASEEEAVEDFEDEEAMMDSATAFGGSALSTTVFDGERFVGLLNVGNGWALRTSVDGVDWVDAPVTGLNGNGYLSSLTFDDGTYVALLDTYDEVNGGNASFVVSSTDGTSWTSTALSNGGANEEAGNSGFTVRDGRVVLVQTVYNSGPDPYDLLVEAGILTAGQVENYCGFDMDDPGGAIDVLVCDYEEEEFFEGPSEEDIQALADRYDEATTDEERAAIEEELELLWGGPGLEVVATLQPGDPLHAELSNFYDGGGESNMTTTVLAGPISGPFSEIAALPADGYYGGLVQIDSGLFLSVESYDERSGTSSAKILTSVDGSSWTEVSSPAGSQGGQLQAFGDVLFYMGYTNDGEINYVSTDGAQTWTTSSLGSSLFYSYTQFISGDAGIVALTQGSVEEFVDNGPAFEEPNLLLQKDGYTLELSWSDGSAIFSSADGVIYELSEEEIFSGFEGVRENPISGDLTFLDPETGDDLVTFTNSDWQAAEEEAYGGIEDIEADYVEPETGTELAFSVDGVSWTTLEDARLASVGVNTSISPVAVGDDEVILSLMTYEEPPEELWAFEIEGREPTDAELAALQEWEIGEDRIEYVRIELG